MSFHIPIADQMRLMLKFVKFKAKQQRMRTADKIIADTTYGKIKGVKWISIYGTPYYSFEGIPFAKPPLGKLRFKAPEEPEPWTGVRRCTVERAKPCQMNIVLNVIQGHEDCLYLNVFTRRLDPQRPVPVMVWIFGGGYQMGEASREMYSPDYFMMEDVVLITITYRLGALGFLSLSDPELDVPGNAGLKDQVLALKWVNENCHFFGGDPANITVFGESAGASSTHYLMMSEKTRGLFHKAVLMSGTAIAPWASTPQRNWPHRLAKATGYRGDDDSDAAVLKHLRHCRPSSMMKVTDDLLTLDERQERLMFCFGPTVEPYASEHCIIPQPPFEMMRNCWGNEIPLLIGGNSFEGLLMFPEVRKYPALLHKLGDYCQYLTPADANLSEEQRREFGLQLKEVYFGDKKLHWDNILHYSDIFSYKYFWHGIHRTLLSRQRNATAPTYLYRFDVDSKDYNCMRMIACDNKTRGTCHADELCYMFYNAFAKKFKHRSAEYKTIRRLISIFVQFAACGDPNVALTLNMSTSSNEGDEQRETALNNSFASVCAPCWQPVGPDDTLFKCLNISDELEVIDLPEAEKLQLWDNMYPDKTLLY